MSQDNIRRILNYLVYVNVNVYQKKISPRYQNILRSIQKTYNAQEVWKIKDKSFAFNTRMLQYFINAKVENRKKNPLNVETIIYIDEEAYHL